MAKLNVELDSEVLSQLDRIIGAAQEARPDGSYSYSDVVDMLVGYSMYNMPVKTNAYVDLGKRLARRVKI